MRILLAIVITMAAAWAGYWFIGSSALRSGLVAWFDARRAEGWVAQYSDLSVHGFPSRFDTTFTDIHLADPASGIGWQAPFFQVLTLSYTPNHVIAVWPHEQRIETRQRAYALVSHDMRASLAVAASTTLAPKRVILTAKGIALSAEDDSGGVSADTLRLAAERGKDVPGIGDARYHLGLAAAAVALPAPLMARLNGDGSLPRVIDTIAADVSVDFNAPWDRHALSSTHPQPTRIAVKNANIHWGRISLAASGVLDIDISGRPSGTLTLAAHNWRQMLDTAARAGLLTPDMANTATRALAGMADMNGNAKTLSVPLTFSGGRIWIGPIPIAPAPVLHLR